MMYSIKAVSEMTGIPSVTIRSWENRYEAIKPERTESGHRVYSRQDVEDLSWLKKQIDDNGMKVSLAVKLLHKTKKEMNTPVTAMEQAVPAAASGDYSRQVEELFEAVQSGDAEKCDQLLDLYFSQFHFRTVFYYIVVPLMQRVGDEWERGTVSVMHEHMISNVVSQRFFRFFRLHPVNPQFPKAAALCPSGEHHQIGLLLFSLFLREQGFEVIYLGPDTPLKDLPEFIREQGVKLVCMSVSKKERLPAAEDYMSGIVAAAPGIQFIVGGKAVDKYKKEGRRWNVSPDFTDWEKWYQDWGASWRM